MEIKLKWNEWNEMNKGRMYDWCLLASSTLRGKLQLSHWFNVFHFFTYYFLQNVAAHKKVGDQNLEEALQFLEDKEEEVKEVRMAQTIHLGATAEYSPH